MVCRHSKILICLLIGNLFSTTQADSPFPPSPVTMQPYVNKSRPNLMLHIDNSDTMENKVPRRYVDLPASQRPRRIDVVKHAAIDMVEKYYMDFNWGISVHRDKYRTVGWAVDASQKGGYNQGIRVDGSMGRNPQLLGFEQYLNTSISKYGKQLILPIINNDGSAQHKQDIINSIKTMYPDTGLLENAFIDLMDYMPNTIQYRCQDTFVIVLTDGNRVNRSDNKRAAGKYSRTDARTSGLDGDGKSWNAPDFPNQYIKTSGIGIGRNLTGFQNFADAGDGFYALAESAEDIMEALEDFVNRLRPKKKLFLPSLPSVSSILDNSDKRLIAILSLDPSDWSSKLEFQKYNDQGVLESTKSSGRYYPDQKMVLASTAAGLVNFTDAAEVSNAGFTPVVFGLSSSQSVTDYVSWLVGGSKRDVDMDFRNRASMLTDERRQIGDSLDSPIVMVGKMNDKISAPEFLAFGSNDGMLKIYRANPNIGTTVEEAVYNSVTGQTELVSVTDESPYEYQFGYIPGLAKKDGSNNILNTLSKRGEHMYGQDALNPHVYGVNGGVFYRTTDKGQTYLVGTMGQGARAAYALNVAGVDQITGAPIGLDAEKSKWKNSIPLWDTSSNQFGHAYSGSQNMGYTVGSAVSGRLTLNRDAISGKPDISTDVRYAAAVSTGYHGTEDGPTLYIYDALGVNVGLGKDQNTVSTHGAGGLIKKLTYIDGNLTHKSSLSSPIMVDLDFDGIVDVAYAGDQNGNLYRFDFRGAKPENWRVELLYKGSPDQPITSAPAFSNYGGKNVVVFGTGSELYDKDVTGSVPEQTIYGIIDDLDNTVAKAPVTKEKLVEQTLTQMVEGGKKVRTVSNFPIPTEKKGWYIDFKGGLGESVVASPQVLNGTVFFTTKILAKGEYADPRDVCFRSLAKDAGWSMALNARTGGTLSSKDTSYVSFIRKDGSSLAGVNSDDGAFSQVQVLYLNDSPLSSADGQILASNTQDFVLGEGPGKLKDSERCKTLAEAHITKGSTPTREEIRSCTAANGSRVRRLSWREIF